MNEFDFIDLLRPLAGNAGLGLNDDAALLKPNSGKDLVLSKDTMVEGVHFPAGRIGGDFAERLLRTALSDLAAKGARPIGYLLSVAWPKGTDPKFITGFVKGLREAQDSFDCPLMGGDTTSTDGPLVASATVIGEVPPGKMVLRSGARDGDDVWFTGILGRAEKGLALIQGKDIHMLADEKLACEEAYLRPEPRFLFREALRRYATAAADVSDGLAVDAMHIATASQMRLHLVAEHLAGAKFGDDYELLFTASSSDREALQETAEKIGLRLTRCGHVSEGEGVWVEGAPISPAGYRHTF